jgi:predicted enzyme related to lactoylglutathione lyase
MIAGSTWRGKKGDEMSDANEQGRFVWYDLMTTEPEKAIGFYTKVAGWSTTAWEGPTPYTMWTSNSTPLGGVMPLDSGAGFPPHWIGYISTPDVDATAKQATALGARVTLAGCSTRLTRCPVRCGSITSAYLICSGRSMR